MNTRTLFLALALLAWGYLNGELVYKSPRMDKW